MEVVLAIILVFVFFKLLSVGFDVVFSIIEFFLLLSLAYPIFLKVESW